jgi:hypothetical protein
LKGCGELRRETRNQQTLMTATNQVALDNQKTLQQATV